MQKTLQGGSIKILESLSKDVVLSFGSESGDISVLEKFADVLCKEPAEYVSLLNHELDRGISYPKARENALLMYLNDIRTYANILSGSNNILAIEYLKAIRQLKSNITPTTIKRNAVEYNSTVTVGKFASATAIRKMIKEDVDIRSFLPEVSYDIVLNNLKHGKVVYDLSIFEKEILYTLRTMSIEQISDLADVTEGLGYRIKQTANECNNLEDLISAIKTKRYTRTRLQRILLYSILNITKKDILDSYKIKPYIRVLGFNQNGKRLLSEVNNSKNTVIASVKRFMDKNNNKIFKSMMEKDILASNIYTLGYEYESKANLDYTNRIVIL